MAERKIRILVDTCVILDLALNREGFVQQARELFALANNGEVDCYISAQSIPTAYHYIKKYNHSEQITRQILMIFLDICYSISMTAKDCLWALQSPSSDYEDTILTETANRENIDTIITRDQKGFKKSTISVLTPEEFLKKWR